MVGGVPDRAHAINAQLRAGQATDQRHPLQPLIRPFAGADEGIALQDLAMRGQDQAKGEFGDAGGIGIARMRHRNTTRRAIGGVHPLMPRAVAMQQAEMRQGIQHAGIVADAAQRHQGAHLPRFGRDRRDLPGRGRAVQGVALLQQCAQPPPDREGDQKARAGHLPSEGPSAMPGGGNAVPRTICLSRIGRGGASLHAAPASKTPRLSSPIRIA